MEEKKLTVREENQIVNTLPTGDEAENIIKWAMMMADTKFYQQMVANGGKNAVVAIFLAARELGIPPIQALNGGLWVVQGRVTLSAQMMGLLIRKRGHSIKKKIGNAEICHLVGKRVDNGDECEVVFTIKQATDAGLTKNPVWKNFPDVMLYNRALSILAKQLFPDAIGNALVEDEIESPAKIEEVKEPMDKESLMFIDKFNLLDLNCPASKFIDSISVNLGQSRDKTIKQVSQDQANFEKNLNKFIEKIKPVVIDIETK